MEVTQCLDSWLARLLQQRKDGLHGLYHSFPFVMFASPRLELRVHNARLQIVVESALSLHYL
jgi:hypothetical protein